MLSIFTAGLSECLSTNLGLIYHHHNRDGLGGITERHPDLNVEAFDKDHPQLVLTDKSGVDTALDLIRTSPSRTITYIALGPLTNLAHMMRQDSKLVRERIGRIICMGGALDVSGNTSPVAECQCSMSMLLALLNNIRYQSTSLQTLLLSKSFCCRIADCHLIALFYFHWTSRLLMNCLSHFTTRKLILISVPPPIHPLLLINHLWLTSQAHSWREHER